MGIATSLHARGYANLGRLLTNRDIAAIRSSYDEEQRFRNHVVMRRHGFGEGDYKYFKYPLPDIIQTLREQLYTKLVPVANEWHERLAIASQFPETHKEMLARCHDDGQNRPTPLILKYASGGFNCLHQDLYGEHVFPLQAVILLSDPQEFTGGEFVLTEQRPRMQSRVEVVPLRKGHGVAFAVNNRPKAGKRGNYRVRMRHGVSEIRQGERFALGIIFHDAA